MTNSLTSTTAAGLVTSPVPRRFILATVAAFGVATVGLAIVNIADDASNTGTDRTAVVATENAMGTFALQPEEAAFISAAVSAVPAASGSFALQSEEAAFITQPTSPAPSVVAVAPVCVAGAAC